MNRKSKEPFIIFFSDGHTYWRGDKKVPSVSFFKKSLFPPFEGRYWETHSMLKEMFGRDYVDHFVTFKSGMPDAEELYGPYLDIISDKDFFQAKKDIRDKWHLKGALSRWRGSKFHAVKEKKAYRDKRLLNPFTNTYYPVIVSKKTYDNESLAENLYELRDGAYLELLVFDPIHHICGQADVVFIETIDSIRYVDVWDFKTGEEKPSRKSRGKIAEPLEHMGNNKHNEYVIQVNLYAKLLQRHGFSPRNLGYTWFENYDENLAHLMKFDYLAGEMNDLYEYFF